MNGVYTGPHGEYPLRRRPEPSIQGAEPV